MTPDFDSDALPDGVAEAIRLDTSDSNLLNRGVLIVDDEELIRKDWRMVLTKAGYTNILLAENPDQAVELLRLNGPMIHALVTDSAMPRMHGLQFVRHLVAHHPHIIGVVMDRGMQTEEAVREFYALGTDVVMTVAVLTKPLQRETMLATVQQVLRLVEAKRGENHP